MFFLLIFIATIAYALQGTLLVHHARKIDGLDLAVWRSLSLIITMAPLLFFVEKSDFALISNFWGSIAVIGISGALSSAIFFWSLKFLPVGTSIAFGSSASTLFILAFGFLLFGEKISSLQGIFIAVILLTSVALGFQKHQLAHLDKRTGLGILIRLVSAFFMAITITGMAKISRELDPFLAGYAWEASIGIFALILVLLRDKFSRWKFQKISGNYFGKILLISSPTLIGTGCFAYAMTLGPVGIASSISTPGNVFLSMVLAHLLYAEKLRLLQWITIAILVAGIVGLKLVS